MILQKKKKSLQLLLDYLFLHTTLHFCLYFKVFCLFFFFVWSVIYLHVQLIFLHLIQELTLFQHKIFFFIFSNKFVLKSVLSVVGIDTPALFRLLLDYYFDCIHISTFSFSLCQTFESKVSLVDRIVLDCGFFKFFPGFPFLLRMFNSFLFNVITERITTNCGKF